jgi:hypothetical protein
MVRFQNYARTWPILTRQSISAACETNTELEKVIEAAEAAVEAMEEAKETKKAEAARIRKDAKVKQLISEMK